MEHRPSRTLERIREAEARTQSTTQGGVCFDPGPELDSTLETEAFHFGRYEVIDELARGGAGVVYRAWDCELERYAALKVMLSGTWENPNRVQSFLREARASARLNDPGVVSVFDVGTTPEGAVWFAMELVGGPSLAEVIADRAPLDIEETVTLFSKVARTLDRVHASGMAHRDIKPSNILISPTTGEPLLTDFGLVIDVEKDELSSTDGPVGTPAYMAPEQAQSDTSRVDWHRADVYALGAVLYEMLTGRQPPAFWHLAEHPLPPVGPDVPRDLESICQKAMSQNPADRYSSVRAFLADVERFSSGMPVLATDTSLAWRGYLFIRRNWPTISASVVTALTFCTVLAVAAAIWLFNMAPEGLSAQAWLASIAP